MGLIKRREARQRKRISLQMEKEKKLVHDNFVIVVANCTNDLFSRNWDSPELKDFDVFKEYDNVWREFCKRFNENTKRVQDANAELFTEFMINNDPRTRLTKNKEDENLILRP